MFSHRAVILDINNNEDCRADLEVLISIALYLHGFSGILNTQRRADMELRDENSSNWNEN
jgi:hypothetical protein